MADSGSGFVEQAKEVRERLRRAPDGGSPASRWTLTRIRAAFPWLRSYSLSGVWRLLQRCKVGLRRGRIQQFSPDPDYEEKEAYLLACLRQIARHPATHVLVFMDEMGFFRWPTPSLDWMAAAPDPARIVACADNNRQWRIIGALNALTGQVNYLDNYIVGRKVVGQWYQKLDQLYPHAQHIYVVQDNWSIHKHTDVRAILDDLPRIEPVWLPTYAPWLNPIEKLWRWLRQDVLHLHRWASDWETLLAKVHAFLDQFAQPSQELLRYVGLLGEGKLASAIRFP
jgi:hypothetical protein